MSAEETVNEGELPLLPLKLEYFRRFNLGVQLAYRKARSDIRKTRWLSPAIWLFIILFCLALWFLLWLGTISEKLQLSSFLIERSFFVVGAIAALVAGTRKGTDEYDQEARLRIEEDNL